MSIKDKLYIVDTTVKASKKLNGYQKLELAKQLDRLKVDVIDLPLENADLSTKIALEIKNVSVGITITPTKDKVDEAWEILSKAKNPRLRLVITPEFLNDIDLRSQQGRNDLIKLVTDALKYCQKLTTELELIIIKSDKIHLIYLYRLIELAAENQVKTVTIAQDENLLLPGEIESLFKGTIENIPEYENLIIGASCHDKIYLSTANTLTAIVSGARQVETSIISENDNNSRVPLTNLLQFLQIRKDLVNLETNLSIEEIENTYRLIGDMLTNTYVK